METLLLEGPAPACPVMNMMVNQVLGGTPPQLVGTPGRVYNLGDREPAPTMDELLVRVFGPSCIN